jgi:enoyl reductase
MAHAIRFRSYGGPEVLELDEVPDPVPGEGELVFEVRAAGVNPVDSKIRSGARSDGTPLEQPVGVGADAAGVVVIAGEGVTEYEVGDEVIGWSLSGAYATRVVAPEGKVTRKPAGVSFEQGAAMGVPVSTAYQVLKSIGVAEGKTLLVHAGAGGVGQAAIQLARLWGVNVVATASPANHARLTDLGAIPIAYGDGLLERVRSAAPQGIDLVLDAVGSEEAIEVSLAVVADPARIGEIVKVEWAEQYGVSYYSGSRPGYLGPEEIALRDESIPYTAALVDEGRFELEIARTYPLAQAAQAQRESEGGHVRGKLILIP